METLKREDRRTLDKAVSMMVGGAKVDVRLRNVLKLYMKEPSHKLGVHEWGMVRKFVGGQNGSAPIGGGNIKASMLTAEDRERLDEAMKLFDSAPPADVRLRAYLSNYRIGKTIAIGEATKGMLKKYLARAKRPTAEHPKARRTHFPEAQAMGLGMSGALEMIGPEAAFAMLEVNERIGFGNRPINKERVARYANDMKTGRWRMTGESIILGKAGQLMNGQHRLYAIIDADIEVPIVVVRGVDDSAFSSMDQGMPRKAADVIGIGGVKNATLTAATLKMIYMWEKFGPTGVVGGTGRSGKSGYDMGFTNETAVEMLAERPRLAESVNVGRKFSKLCAPSAASFAHWLCAEKSRAAADDFFEKLRSGLGIGARKGDPIYTLRQRIINDRANPLTGARSGVTVRMMLRMWNAWRRGEALERIPNLTDSEPQRPV